MLCKEDIKFDCYLHEHFPEVKNDLEAQKVVDTPHTILHSVNDFEMWLCHFYCHAHLKVRMLWKLSKNFSDN